MTPKPDSWREYAEGLVRILQAQERLLADADLLAEAAIVHAGLPVLHKAAQVYREHRKSLHEGVGMTPKPEPKRCLSFGAGVQTTALLVLIAQRDTPRPDAIVFADTGAEHIETYRYLADVAIPYARKYELAIEILGSQWRTPHTRPNLEAYCLRHHMLPGTWVRWCTDRYKVKPIARYLKALLGACKASPVESWIGISTDEQRRAKPSQEPHEVKRYPLIEMGLSRLDCEAVIQRAGLPVPRKSGCWFCPFQRQSEWHRLKRENPDLFERALALERNAHGKDGKPKYLPMFGSLDRVAMQDEIPGFDVATDAEAGCVTGACFV